MKEKIEISEEVQKLIISFAKENLTQEEENLCLYIWKKLTRKRKLEITRTRTDIWAAAVIWTFCRANFKYEEGITLDFICQAFDTKKRTVGTKARDIIDMLKIDYFSPEFSTRKVLEDSSFNIFTDLIYEDSDVPEETLRPVKKPDAKRLQAEDMLLKGLELHKQGDLVESGRFFFRCTEIDPSYAEGYNILALLAWQKEDWAQAEGLYRKALTLAEPETKDVPRGDYGEVPESMPFLRALRGLGLVVWQQGKLEEARGIFEKMLKLDSNDNLAVRYHIGPLYHQMGDPAKAVEWYEQNTEDPRGRFNHALILTQQNKLELAAGKLITAVLSNSFVAPLLLKEKLPEGGREYSGTWAEPEYAEKYIKTFGGWWEKEESALRLLRAIWRHGEVQRMVLELLAAVRLAIQSGKADPEKVKNRLTNPAKIKRLARVICQGLTGDKGEQMKLI